MRARIIGLVAAASLVFTASALASGVAPSAPTGVALATQFTTKTSLALMVKSACDPDGDFGVNVGGYFDFQLNGVTWANYAPQQPNCVTDPNSSFGYKYSSDDGIHPPLTCGTGYTLRVRAVDLAGHHGPFVTIGASQGAKTLAC